MNAVFERREQAFDAITVRGNEPLDRDRHRRAVGLGRWGEQHDTVVGQVGRHLATVQSFVAEHAQVAQPGELVAMTTLQPGTPFNALLDKQRGQFDIAERKKTVTEIETICAEEQYEIYWSTDTRSYFWDADIENYRPTSFYPFVNPVRAWREK